MRGDKYIIEAPSCCVLLYHYRKENDDAQIQPIDMDLYQMT